MVNYLTCSWKEVIYLDGPEQGPINQETVAAIKSNSNNYRGSVRQATGRVWIDEEFEKRKKDVLSRPMP